MHYDNGASADVSSDSRLNVSLVAASMACASVQGLAQVVLASGADCSSIVVLVTMPALSPSLNVTVSVPVVTLQALQLTTSPFPSYSGSSTHTNVPLYKLDCTSYYQHATASLVAQLSDASQYTVTSQSAFSSSDMAVLKVASARLRSLSAGTIRVRKRREANAVTVQLELRVYATTHTGQLASAAGERRAAARRHRLGGDPARPEAARRTRLTAPRARLGPFAACRANPHARTLDST